MRKNFWWVTCAFLLLPITLISWKPISAHRARAFAKPASSAREMFEGYVDGIYQEADLQSKGLEEDVFQKAVTGYFNLKADNKLPGNSSIITIVDYNKPSREKRMWIVDLVAKHLVINTWVAHGNRSGRDVATRFSNGNNSHKSSLGFYIADDIYYGKHGRSLRLDGMDQGFNDNARMREIVVHAADYVGEGTINALGRLGCSFGCPAVSPEVLDEVVDAIQGKTMFFINAKSRKYTSKYLDEDVSANAFSQENTTTANVPAKVVASIKQHSIQSTAGVPAFDDITNSQSLIAAGGNKYYQPFQVVFGTIPGNYFNYRSLIASPKSLITPDSYQGQSPIAGSLVAGHFSQACV